MTAFLLPLLISSMLHCNPVLACAVVFEAERQHVDPVLACALVECESSWETNVVSTTHDEGLFQINAIYHGRYQNIQEHIEKGIAILHGYLDRSNENYVQALSRYNTGRVCPQGIRYAMRVYAIASRIHKEVDKRTIPKSSCAHLSLLCPLQSFGLHTGDVLDGRKALRIRKRRCGMKANKVRRFTFSEIADREGADCVVCCTSTLQNRYIFASDFDVYVAAAEQREAMLLKNIEAHMDTIRKQSLQLADSDQREAKLSANIQGKLYVDITPDEGMICRILSAYIDETRATDNTIGLPPENPICIAMNEAAEKRNEILRDALKGEARHEFVVASWKREEDGWDKERARLKGIIEGLVGALKSAKSGEWGAIKAWIVEGAPTREQGIAAAKRLTHLNVLADAAIAESKEEI